MLPKILGDLIWEIPYVMIPTTALLRLNPLHHGVRVRRIIGYFNQILDLRSFFREGGGGTAVQFPFFVEFHNSISAFPACKRGKNDCVLLRM